MSSTLEEIKRVLSEWEQAKQTKEVALNAVDERYASEIRSLEERVRLSKAAIVAANTKRKFVKLSDRFVQR